MHQSNRTYEMNRLYLLVPDTIASDVCHLVGFFDISKVQSIHLNQLNSVQREFPGRDSPFYVI